MTDRASIQVGTIGGLLTALVCCAAPFLIVTLRSLGLGSLLAGGSYLFIPLLVVVLGLVGLRLHQRHATAQLCRVDKFFKEGANL